MKGIVVYKSFWGSCKRVAEAIVSGLAESGHDVRAVSVEDAGQPDPSLDFFLIGAATRWPGAWPKIKGYARKVAGSAAGKPFAAFSTGGTLSTDAPNQQASELLYEILEKGGLKPLAQPLKISIVGYKPPGVVRGELSDGEIERAVQFGREVGAGLAG